MICWIIAWHCMCITEVIVNWFHDYAEKPHGHGKLKRDKSRDTGDPYSRSSGSHSTQMKVCHLLCNLSRYTIVSLVSAHAYVMATWSRSLLASLLVSPFSQDSCSFVKHEASYTKFVTLLPRFSCLLRIESVHNRATIIGHAFMQLRSVERALMRVPFGVLACRSCLSACHTWL